MTSLNDQGEEVSVLYVSRTDAKRLKNILEQQGLLNKDFRMAPATCEEWKDCIAVPIIKESQDTPKLDGVHGDGVQFCRYSSSLLGNHLQRRPRKQRGDSSSRTLVQLALWNTCEAFRSQSASVLTNEQIWEIIQSLNIAVCPRNLELLGDDDTLVIHRRAFDRYDEDFRHLIHATGCQTEEAQKEFMSELWKQLATVYKSPRVVRKGEVDPDSGVRESGYLLLWPYSGVPDQTGPGSPGWITVTEQGIRQSFDLTRVMFSRGNISEKIRFGKLVQRGEIVLDLYGGIGYFTLPALVHGKAEYVYACEWNEHAIKALEFNLHDNGVETRATVLHGDCRAMAKKYNLVDMFDRVSLGLLPSSEGGWRTAVRALRRSTGGWLHVHGNVPVNEVDNWRLWLCSRLLDDVREIGMDSNLVVLCTHLEKVKSFAPTVNHYVADCFVGPCDRLSYEFAMEPGTAGVVRSDQRLELCPGNGVSPPSCALSPHGVLNQAWMREEKADTNLR